MIDAVGYLASAITVFIALPQAIRSRRHGTAGVSSATYQVFFVANVAWTIYDSAKGYWPALPGLAGQLVGSAIVIYECHRERKNWRETLSFLMPLTVVVIATSGLIDTLGWIAVFLSLAVAVPQAIEAMKSNDVEGVSVLTWLIWAASSAVWFLYGFFQEDPRLMVVNAAQVVLCLLIVVIVEARRKQGSSAPAHAVR